MTKVITLFSENTPPESEVYVQRCIDNLQSPNPRQRSQAAQELGKLKASHAISVLISLLGEDVNTYVRSACAEALGHIGDAAAIFPLMDALRDSSTFVRRSAAISLGQMQAKEAQGALLQTLQDPNFYVRRAAINAIGKLGVSDLGQMLLPFLDVDDPRIRRTTVTALRRLRTEAAVPALNAALVQYMEKPSPRDLPVVKTLVLALGELRAVPAVPVLIQVVQGYVGARSLAAGALGQIGDARANPVLIEALADRSANLRIAALKSLGMLRCEEARPHVKPFLTATDPRLRRAATLTLGQLANPADIPVLMTLVREDDSPLVRPVAVEALGVMGDARVVTHLLPFAEDANAYLRAALVNTLLALDGHQPEVEKVLGKLAQDKVAYVARAAQCALDTYQQKPAVPDAPPPVCADVVTEAPLPWFKRWFSRSS